MGRITITDLDDDLTVRLQQRAEENGRTLEDEVKGILADAAPYVHAAPENLAEAVRSLFEPLGGVELELPERGFAGEGPWFGWDEKRDGDNDNS